MKRVLLTGAGGFVGSHVLRHIMVNTDWEVVLLASFRHKGKIDRIHEQMKDIPSDRVTLVLQDLTFPISVQTDYAIGHIDYVLNLASESHVDRSITHPRVFIENNVQLILTMMEWLKKRPLVEKFVQISTDEVYGPAPQGYNHKEGEPHRPSNPYSASKSCQEDICYTYWRTYGLPVIITNTMNIIGEMQDPEKFVPMTIKKIFGGETVSVHASQDKKTIGSRFYLHARNQADALLYILNTITPVKDGDLARFNIVGEKELNNLELAKLVARFAGKDLKYELVDFHSSRPGHDLRYALDGTRLAEAGWQAPLSLEDSLQKTVEWTLRHKEWLLDD